MDNKQDFIKFMSDAGALRFGDFTLKSGRRSPYFINTGAFDTGKKIARLGSFYAARVKDAMDAGDIPKEVATVFGPAYKGVPIAVATATALASEHGIDVGYTFNRKETKDHGEGGGFVGRALKDGDRIIMVDDVITAGTAIREATPLIRSVAAVKICGLVLAVDRMERGRGAASLSAVEEIREELGVPVYPLVTIKDILDAASRAGAEGRPIADDDILNRMRAYLSEYCAPHPGGE
ncbi:MAG: orotate phosphoribosyltransferase [Clostridiales Family XIII bacterium]|jgi:orotate phosphoribosyltransferase|nr:orotate phosphoribosyltransferase [Clostridiales Family XIII bacterium]